MIKHDEMTPTNINTPSAPAESTPAPLAVPKAQESISAATAVEPTKTSEITAAPAVQASAPPKTAGGNLITQQAAGQASVALPLQQSQNAPQVLTSVSNLKTS